MMQWIVAPVAAFVFMMHRRMQGHDTDIAVLKAMQVSTKEAYDREFSEVGEGFRNVLTKLESIEQHLRK
jgi:hypothetical protein